MNYILLLTSILIATATNMFSNHFSKAKLGTFSDAIFYNIIYYIGAIIFCIFLPGGREISTFSLVMAFLFALITAGGLLISLFAMKSGPMSYTVLLSSLGMIISTLYGVIAYKQSITPTQIVGFILMIVTFYATTDKSGTEKFSVKWFILAFMGFVMCGLIGIIQLIHQSSEYAHEINIFLLWGFIFSLIISVIIFIFTKKPEKKQSLSLIKTNIPLIAVISGLFCGTVNMINLYLSGKMPSIIFFPSANGGVIILSSIAAITIFKEKLSRRQTIGIITGIIAVCLLSI